MRDIGHRNVFTKGLNYMIDGRAVFNVFLICIRNKRTPLEVKDSSVPGSKKIPRL